MKSRKVILHGQTDKHGNLLMANRAEMLEFFKQWPNTYFTLAADVYNNTSASTPLQGYYKAKVVPDMQRAFHDVEGLRLTQEQTDLRLREASPIMQKEKFNQTTQRWEKETLDIYDLDNQQLVFFIEHLKEFAAEEYGVYIQEPGYFK